MLTGPTTLRTTATSSSPNREAAQQAERWRSASVAAARTTDQRRVDGLRTIVADPHADAQRTAIDSVLSLHFDPGYDQSLVEQRRRLTAAITALGRAGIGRMVGAGADGSLDLARSLAVVQALAWCDTGLYLKAAVQFGLVSHGLLVSGTHKHHRAYLDDVIEANVSGCYAMTEVGHGSNVRRLETTATYDPRDDTFVVHSPSITATKQMVGNAALDARFAVVFAQLCVGDARPGVFGFVVPLRDDNGVTTPGVERGDMGVKGGFNGMDNGWLRFDHVRIPRADMLDRFGTVREGGHYEGHVPDPTKALLSTVSDGRLVTTVGALGALKVGLASAVRYGTRRRQFGPRRGPENALLSYPAHQLRLLPSVAALYALDLTAKALIEAREAGTTAANDIDRDCAAIKVASSSIATRALQHCRECCGGQGYLAANRITVLRADVDALTTLEGDNTLLRFQVAKTLLTAHASQGVRGLAGLVANRLRRAAYNKIGVGRPGLTDLPGLLRARHNALLDVTGLDVLQATRVRGRWGGFVDTQPQLLELADAYIDDMLCRALDRASSPGSAAGRTLQQLRDLFGLTCVLDDAASYVRLHLVAPRELVLARRRVLRLCRELASSAAALTDAFGIPEACMPPIARRDGLPAFLQGKP